MYRWMEGGFNGVGSRTGRLMKVKRWEGAGERVFGVMERRWRGECWLECGEMGGEREER